MASLNKVMIIGRLGADPELKNTNAGSVCNLRFATDESYTDRDGNRQERTEWHSVVVFNKTAENCAAYLHKGSMAYVEGRLQTRKWQDQNGQDRYSTEIRADRVQFLDSKGGQQGQQGAQQTRRATNLQQSGSWSQNDNMAPSFPSEAGNMDEMPF